jgi:hypothetical protein
VCQQFYLTISTFLCVVFQHFDLTQVEAILVVTLCRVDASIFTLKMEASTLRGVTSRRPRLESSLLWKPEISHFDLTVHTFLCVVCQQFDVTVSTVLCVVCQQFDVTVSTVLCVVCQQFDVTVSSVLCGVSAVWCDSKYRLVCGVSTVWCDSNYRRVWCVSSLTWQ